jgi:hypothetical protein
MGSLNNNRYDKLTVFFKRLSRGFEVIPFLGDKYQLLYPVKIFRALPESAKLFIAENFTYARTRPLTLLGSQLSYNQPVPALKKFVDWGIVRDLPCIADLNGLSAKKSILNFKNESRKVQFDSNQPPARLPILNSQENRAVLALSFGKDSLLSYGFAKDIGLNYLLAVGNEMENEMGGEWKIKSAIIRKFCRQEKEKVYLFSDNVDEIFYNRRFKVHLTEADDTNSMLAYAIELLPFVYKHQAKYLILGNERNLNDYFISAEGYRVYPAYDQVGDYTAAENKEWDRHTFGRFQVVSFLEPLYNLAEIKILSSRYPHLLQYWMSCTPDRGSTERWCYHCPMCAKAFLYSAAVGVKPKQLFFSRNFFEKKYSELYPIFAKKRLRHYERPPQVKEEQLLAFLFCYKNGLNGGLIDLFKKNYLATSLKQEKHLRKKYFGIHQFVNVPKELQSSLLRIFQEELKDLR